MTGTLLALLVSLAQAPAPTSPAHSDSLITNAIALWRTDRFEEARAEALRVLALLADAGPDRDGARARCLHLLANVAQDEGDLDAAVDRWTELHALRERVNGPESAEAAQVLHNLGIALRQAGRLREAMQAYGRALDIRERVLGPDHLDVAWTLNNLANVFFDLGDYAESIRLNRRALDIREQRLGTEDPVVALSLNNLANAMERNGDPRGAIPLHERALAIRERAYGRWHRDVAQSLNNLGLARMRLGDLEPAGDLYGRSIAIRDSLLGPGSEEAARTRLRLGLLYVAMNRPGDAERVLREAVAANRQAWGPAHPYNADAEIALACALLRLGQDGEALDVALGAERITLDHLRITAQGLDEAQALIYATTRSSGLDVALTLAAASPQETALSTRVWDALIRSRSVVLDQMIARRRWAALAGEDAGRGLYAEVSAARDRLARLALEGAGTDAGSSEAFTAAMAAKRRAERALAERSLAFRGELAQTAGGFPEVRAALPDSAALIAYVWYRHLPQSAAADTVESVLAFVLSPGAAGPRTVPLGAASRVDDVARRWLVSLRSPPNALSRARDERACEDAGRELARWIWDPIQDLLASAERVFVVPEGVLHGTPLAALPGRDGEPLALARGPLIEIVGIERDLIGSATPERIGHGLLAIGGPAFDQDAGGTPTGAPRASDDPCAILEGGRFEPLPGAAEEVAQVARAWNAWVARDAHPDERAHLLTGAGAREGALRAEAGRRRALHVAAHGFFLPPRCPLVSAWRADGVTPSSGQPLLRAGLALAGANARRSAADPADDGILTAEEVAALDLASLEWVVLSACDTGLGELDVNEGVMGLRRAFRAAGARGIVMSLWRVDDAEAGEWMQALYEARFREGLDGAASARQASRRVLDARRSDGRSTHPYYWATFVFEGGARPRGAR